MSAFCQQDWEQVDEDNLAIGILTKNLHPDLPAGQWEIRTSEYTFICHICRCQIVAASKYYWHGTGWVAYHPQCVQRRAAKE